ncbi:CIC11C00000004287 [Sungouiella intermedia]|uniref:CIC11C00000000238 n=1 Tax=Sungouiella intermedia TaxID=45354 RepID=A0A1L0C5J2_9ASCO|nr:CIC11C00000004287 [[Candida] intermedia]SGZ58863.1 CIC11C00000000238 [[Candida] intermedia]
MSTVITKEVQHDLIVKDKRSSTRKVWDMYYHHFPFFMLTGPESIMLHIFILTFVSFIIFGLYNIPLYFRFLVSRSYYYLTGADSKI